MMDSISSESVYQLLLYLLSNVIFVAVFLFLASKMYIKGVSDINTTKSKRSKSIASQAVENQPKRSFCKLFEKEFLILFRTPPFFMDCIAINLLWPVFMAVIMICRAVQTFCRAHLHRTLREIKKVLL